MTETTFRLATHPVHLGPGATVDVLEAFDGTPQWYERYGTSRSGDGVEGRLVSMHTFDRPWDTWEMHPHGHKLVVCTAGRITLHQEVGDGVRTVVLEAGEAVINDPGIWHTADVEETATAFFVTAGLGTEVRPR